MLQTGRPRLGLREEISRGLENSGIFADDKLPLEMQQKLQEGMKRRRNSFDPRSEP